MLKTVTHPFVPYQVAFARREVMLTRDSNAATAVVAGGERCGLRFLDATSLTSNVQEGDWIVTRAAEDERHLWRIVEASGLNERRDVVLVPRNRESAPPLFAGAHDEQREAKLQPHCSGQYYLDVLGLYLLNLFVANSPTTVNGREKINVNLSNDRANKSSAGIIGSLLSSLQNHRNQLGEIYGFVAGMYYS